MLLMVPAAVFAQDEGTATQALIRTEKQNMLPTASAINLKLDGRSTPLISLTQVTPATAQVALLIDDGLSRSAGIQLNDLKDFAANLPGGVELMVGYMANGRIETLVPFTTDHAAAAASIRLPSGVPGVSASPYFCLSDFVKHWPAVEGSANASPLRKARFVMMITNGVDPYNGSTSILNQDSPYVSTAIDDAQRTGVAVSSIYYRDAGYRGNAASLSGQSYLNQVAEGTGGQSYYQGSFTPVTLTPYLKQFTADLSETFVATFNAKPGSGGREHLVTLKVESVGPKVKFHYPSEVRPGNKETAAGGE